MYKDLYKEFFGLAQGFIGVCSNQVCGDFTGIYRALPGFIAQYRVRTAGVWMWGLGLRTYL